MSSNILRPGDLFILNMPNNDQLHGKKVFYTFDKNDQKNSNSMTVTLVDDNTQVFEVCRDNLEPVYVGESLQKNNYKVGDCVTTNIIKNMYHQPKIQYIVKVFEDIDHVIISPKNEPIIGFTRQFTLCINELRKLSEDLTTITSSPVKNSSVTIPNAPKKRVACEVIEGHYKNFQVKLPLRFKINDTVEREDIIAILEEAKDTIKDIDSWRDNLEGTHYPLMNGLGTVVQIKNVRQYTVDPNVADFGLQFNVSVSSGYSGCRPSMIINHLLKLNVKSLVDEFGIESSIFTNMPFVFHNGHHFFGVFEYLSSDVPASVQPCRDDDYNIVVDSAVALRYVIDESSDSDEFDFPVKKIRFSGSENPIIITSNTQVTTLQSTTSSNTEASLK